MRLQDTIKTIVKKVPHSPTPQTVVQELIDIAEKGNENMNNYHIRK
jgi:hypothetical protein